MRFSRALTRRPGRSVRTGLAIATVAAIHAAPGATPIAAAVGPDAPMHAPANCPAEYLPLRTIDKALAGKPATELPVDLAADSVERTEGGPIVLIGNAEVVRGQESITGKEIRYMESTATLDAKGDVVLRSPLGDRLSTSVLHYKMETGIGETGAAHFDLVEPKTAAGGRVVVHGHGEAERVDMEGAGLMRLQKARYTTCPRGNNDVVVRAGELRVDESIGTAVAKDLTVEFMNVPIFYAPRMSFPISDERKSGFLTPSFGSVDGSGFFLGLPYYWNIAADTDATITPKYFADRGLQVDGELRYLRHDYQGEMRGAYMPDDNNQDGDYRAAFTWHHKQSFGHDLYGLVDYEWVSDDHYLDDFENRLGFSAKTHLPQRALLAYLGPQWRVTAEASGYETIDPTISKRDEPHARLPRIAFSSNFPTKPGSLKYGVDGEVVYFEHDVATTGTRLNLTPYVSFPMTKLYGYLTPKVSIRHTSYYGLENIPSGLDDSPTRTAGVFSVDGGLYFDRDTELLGHSFNQTLEPRAYYVYATREDHTGIPVFDSGETPLDNFASLFRDNLYYGGDYVEDANRLTLALTSRLIEGRTGREWIRASVGQIYFFDDRQVGYPSTRDYSDILGEVRARLSDDWYTQALLQWDTEADETRQGRFDVHYRPAPDKHVAVMYRYTRDDKEQADFVLEWPLTGRWYVAGRYLYDLRNSKALETYGALEYDSCCWAVRLAAQNRVDELQGRRSAILIQLELSGLTAFKLGL